MDKGEYNAEEDIEEAGILQDRSQDTNTSTENGQVGNSAPIMLIGQRIRIISVFNIYYSKPV